MPSSKTNLWLSLLFAVSTLNLALLAAHLLSHSQSTKPVTGLGPAPAISKLNQFHDLDIPEKVQTATAITLNEVRVSGDEWSQYVLEIIKQPDSNPLQIGQKVGVSLPVADETPVPKRTLTFYLGQRPREVSGSYIYEEVGWSHYGYSLTEIKDMAATPAPKTEK